jgi:hypothetical protein
MIAFQVDENFRDKHFAAACNSEGLASVAPFPPELRGKADDDVLDAFLARERPIVTNDINIAAHHPQAVPQRHPGIIIVCYSPGNPRTSTMKGLQKIIFAFKKAFSAWHSTSYANSIIQLTELDVHIWHKEGDSIRRDHYIPFTDRDWVGRLQAALIQNSTRWILEDPAEEHTGSPS